MRMRFGRCTDEWFFFLMVSKGLKRSLPSVFSTRFSFDKSLAQILHHRFCIAVRRFLSILRSFLQIASLAFGRNGDSSRILKAFALPPIILDILATYPAIYHERIWIWSTEKHFWASSVVLACSLDPTKIGGPFNNLTVVHKIQRNLQTTAAHDTRLVAIESEKHEPNSTMVWMRIKIPDVHSPLAPQRL